MFKQGDRVECFVFCIPYGINEITYRTRCETSTAKPGYGRHTRVVPSCHESFFDKLEELAFRHYCVCEVETIELNLSGAISLIGELLYEIFIEGAVRHKFKCAYRVGDSFKIIALAMGEVVHGVYFPCGACAVMRGLYDAIHNRITEMHIGVSHIDLGAEHS